MLKSLLFKSLLIDLMFSCTAFAASEGLDVNKIGIAAGSKPMMTADGVIKLSWPRTDVPVTVDGVLLKPFAGLGSWAAFTVATDGAIVMGDTVVFQDEVNVAMDAAFAAGLEVTGLHNHFFFDHPKVYFMHIGGHGDQEMLAASIKKVWDAIKKVRAEHFSPAENFGGPQVTLGRVSSVPLESILELKAGSQDGVVKFIIGREGFMHGVKVADAMGLTTWAAFSGTDDLAVMDGDFIMTGNEVQAILKSLRKAKINVVALHNHMIGETPTLYFTHFWAKGPANDLAKAFKEALDVQAAIAGKDTP